MPSPPDDEIDWFDLSQTGGERLQGAAHRRRDDEGGLAVPRGDATQHVEATPHRLGAGAEALVGQGLPRGEVQDVRAGEDGIQGGSEGLRATAGRGDHEHGARIAGRPPTFDEARDDGGVEAVDEGEREVGGGRGGGLAVRLSLLEGAHDPGNCHSGKSTRGL